MTALRATPPIGVAEAVARVLASVRPLAPERVALAEALGRVLAEPLLSPVTLPAWTNAGMDGYAVRAGDVSRATAAAPVRLPVVETVAAGAFPSRALARGEAMRIMTGAPVPDGADTVIRVEDSDGGVDVVEIRSARDAGRNLRPRGEDMRPGDVVLPAHTNIGAGQVGALAACGAASVDVFRRPRVAIVGSGDELVDLDRFHEALAGRKVVGTNNHVLGAIVRDAGGIAVDLGTAADGGAAIAERLSRARGCDLIVTSAGNSVGAFDHTRDVLVSLGGTIDFWRVRMRPGAPLGAGAIEGTPWLGLPGNPVSAFVTGELFVRPAVRRMLGDANPLRGRVPVRIEEAVSSTAPGLTHFLRAIVVRRADGELSARLTGPQGSGLLSSTARANALLVLAEGQSGADVGDVLDAILLSDPAPSDAAARG